MGGENGGSRLAPEFKVLINNSDLPAKAAQDIISVTVQEDVDAAGMFTLRMIDWDMAQLEVTWADDPLFSAGNEVQIQMGYVNQTATLMVGEITCIEPEFCADDVPVVVIRGHDRRHRLLRGRKTRSFSQVTDSDIASQIASGAGLIPTTDNTVVQLDYVLQNNQSDFEFLQERARRYGYEVVVEDKAFYFRKRKNAGSADLTLGVGNDLIEFYPRLSTLGQVGQVAVQGWSPNDKEAITAQSDSKDQTTTMGGTTSGPDSSTNAFGAVRAVGVNRPVFTRAEAETIAKSRFNEMALTYITGEGVCVGRTDLRAGKVLQITGVGKRFSGLYYVTSTRHTYTPSHGYRTAFAVRRNAA